MYHDKISDLSELEVLLYDGMEYQAYKNRTSNLYDLLVKNEKNNPDKIFLIDEEKELQCTFRDILQRVESFAAYLYYEWNISKGDIVSGILYNSIEHVIVFLSLQKIGSIYMPLPTKYTENEINRILKMVTPKLLVSEKKESYACQNKLVLENELKIKTDSFMSLHRMDYECEETAVGIIMHTSGTTGINKAAVIKNFNIVHAIETYTRFFGLNKESQTILAIPMYNITGLIGIFATFLCCQGTIYLMKKFDSEKILNLCRRKEIDFYHGSPTVLISLIQEAIKKTEKYDKVKLICCGSGNMTPKNISLLKSIFTEADFRVIYGLTETTSPCTIMSEDSLSSTKTGSCGKPICGVNIKILKEDGKEAKTREQGEINVRGTNIITQYYPQNFGLIDQDGWLKTGDIGYLDEDGYLYIKDRIKDIVNRGGEKIYCYEVENEIANIQSEKIKEVAIVAREDFMYGEVPVAIISSYDGKKLNIDHIKSEINYKIAKYKRPVEYYQLDELPKNANGKVDKKLLKEQMKEWEENHAK